MDLEILKYKILNIRTLKCWKMKKDTPCSPLRQSAMSDKIGSKERNKLRLEG